jgi:hypothetical protein
VTVVVLGSTSTDSFYFHHSEYLSRPRDEHLEIPLDEENQFVRTEHMTAAMFDYFNVHDGVDAEQIYRGDRGSRGPDIGRLEVELGRRRDDLREWLRSGFDEDDATVAQVIEELESYLGTLDEPLVPGEDDTPFWEAFREAVEEAGTSGSSQHIDQLARVLRRREGDE